MKTLQQGLPLGRGEACQSRLERAVAAVDPRAHLLLRLRVQVDQRAPSVIRILAAIDERVILEVAGELARGRQRQAELAGDLAHRARPFRRDVREDGDMPPPERRVTADQRQQLIGRAAAIAEAARDPPEQLPELAQLVDGNTHDLIIVML